MPREREREMESSYQAKLLPSLRREGSRSVEDPLFRSLLMRSLATARGKMEFTSCSWSSFCRTKVAFHKPKHFLFTKLDLFLMSTKKLTCRPHNTKRGEERMGEHKGRG